MACISASDRTLTRPSTYILCFSHLGLYDPKRCVVPSLSSPTPKTGRFARRWCCDCSPSFKAAHHDDSALGCVQHPHNSIVSPRPDFAEDWWCWGQKVDAPFWAQLCYKASWLRHGPRMNKPLVRTWYLDSPMRPEVCLGWAEHRPNLDQEAVLCYVATREADRMPTQSPLR